MSAKLHLRLLAASLCACTLIACNKGSDSVSPDYSLDANSVPKSSNTMVVSIDGGPIHNWMASGVKFIFGDTIITVAGAETQKGVGVGLLGIHSPGTYTIATEDTVGGILQTVDMDYIYFLPGDTVKYLTPTPFKGSPSVGTLNVIELTQTSLKATFSATLNKIQGISGALTIKISGAVNAILPK